MFNVFLTQNDGIILGPIAKLLGYILNLIFDFLNIFGIANAGLCIILFTFIVKALMIPLTLKQQKFSKMSSTMNPELQAIQAKYKGKKDEASMRKQQLETQAVYEKYGASPTSGCLPMLITLPIMFALYRVIYNIPAYVDSIYVLYENIASGIMANNPSGYTGVMLEYAEEVKVITSKWEDVNQLGVNHVIDILSQFQRTTWQGLTDVFPSLANVIGPNSSEIIKINSFLGGLNIADKPGLTWPGILIPIFAMGFQFIQGKQLEKQTPQDPNNPAGNTMKTMNNVMPIMSGVFCISLPIGVGLYWVAGSVFQIIQQFFITKYMNTIDVDDLIAKNKEKAKKKKIKKGIDPEMTKSISEVATKKNASTVDYANIKTNKESSNSNISDVSYKKGSISANANLLRKDASKQEDK